MNEQRRAAAPILQSTHVPTVQIPPPGEPFALAVDREWYGHELERHARRACCALHARDELLELARAAVVAHRNLSAIADAIEERKAKGDPDFLQHENLLAATSNLDEALEQLGRAVGAS